MKKRWILLLIFGITNYHGFSQSRSESANVWEYNPEGALYIIRLAENRFVATENLVISGQDIDSLEIFSRVEILKRYGVFAKSTTMVVKLKMNVILLGLDNILDKYEIKDKTLPIYIDEQHVYRPQTIVAAQEEIKSVALLTNSDKSQIINIATYHPTPKTKHKIVEYFPLQAIESWTIDSLLNHR
jgi:hypothetical protein